MSKAPNASSVWSLALSLMTSAHRRCGTLTAQRLYSARALQLDINLLTATFPHRADALDRALAHTPQVIVLSAQDGS